ncbi:MAG: bifunctional riboflavin kinase/FAD synthetase [Campylobacteraceae bacterium]|nr:bifunctional riboflavin kinase/FAD synthetase [Campylobacteraceae bacterium]
MLKHSTILRKDSIDTIAIGSFDGIHLGHRQLIDKLGDNGALFVIDKDQANLTPGIKRSEYSTYPCMFYHFLKVKNLSGAEFIALLHKEFIHLKKILVGYDFQFGHNRSCNVYDLKALFEGEVEIVDEFSFEGISIHSSTIRDFLKKGMVAEANRFLGREYSIIGSMIEGQGLGKAKLVPTVNLKVVDYLVPKDGVYATRTKIDKKVYASISFIGNRMSTDDAFSIETHILDENIETPNGNLEIFFVSYMRENQKFDALSDLKKQIHQDITEAKEVLKKS